jgi:integrase
MVSAAQIGLQGGHEGITLPPEQTSSLPSTERNIVPQRRFQRGRVFYRKESGKWCGSYREHETNPITGQRIRRTITFPDDVQSERAARRELDKHLDAVNDAVPALPVKKSGKKLRELVEEWRRQILPNFKLGSARAAQSHIRTYIMPLVGDTLLRDLNDKAHQEFVTAVGLRVDRRKTVENVYGTLTSILNRGRVWKTSNYASPEVNRKLIDFPADKKPKQEFFFDQDLATRVINASDQPFKTMFTVCGVLGLRIGEVTALKVTSLDFRRKRVEITAALDYATRKETTPKSENSERPLCMTELLEKCLRDWLDKHYRPNPEGYLFTGPDGLPYRSDYVVRYGVHRAMNRVGVKTPKGVHVGVHCFRHGVTTGMLESGTPIHIVTRAMRHGDSKVTLNHYAHVSSDADRIETEKWSQKIGQNLAQLESDELAPIRTTRTG